MAAIKSRKHPHTPATAATGLQLPRLGLPALAAAATLGLPGLALAQAAAAPQAAASSPTAATSSTSLPAVRVRAQAEVPYKAESSSVPKLTQPLVDTPKTVQIVNQEMLREQGAATLMEALRNTPGITMQLGENGNTSAGDTFQLRGFSAQTSTFVDGIRDLGPVTRDVFNVDQVEIAKGPSGAEFGRGASAGYINLVSKLPTRDTLLQGSLTLGSASRKRATADLNQALGQNSAFRLNAMMQDSGVDGRNEVKNKGWGLAPSVAFGLGTPTRIYLYSQHLRQDNVPDGGTSTIGFAGFYNANASVRAGAKTDRKNFYGSTSDYEKIDADMVTARIEHELGSGITVRNLSRYGRSHMDRVLTGINAITAVTEANPATWTVSRSRQRVNQKNEILANQTNVTAEIDTGGLKHSLSAGLEFMYEYQLSRGTGTAAQTIRGVNYAAVAAPAANLYNPNASDVLGVPYLTGVDTTGRTVTAAAYVFDTIAIGESLKLNGGLRYERYSTTTDSGTLVTSTNLASFPGYAVGGVAPSSLANSDRLTSWNLGAVYKPAANGSVYVSVANSLLPPGGNNFSLSATEGNQANAALDPQETTSYELGTKWELLNQRLSLSAALYRSENDKQVTQNAVDGSFSQFGKTRVEGIELAAVGQITNFWQVSAGIQTMKTKQLGQRSRNATTGVVTVTEGVRWSPEFSASLWTSYTLEAFTLGGGLRHTGEQLRTITAGTDLSTQNMPRIPASTVADLMAAWRVNKNLNLQLNVYNLFDKEYISTLNNGGSRATLGQPRSFALTASVQF